MIEIRRPVEDDYAGMTHLIRATLGGFDAEHAARERQMMDLDRFRIAVDARRRHVVGVAGSYGFDLTVPGLAAVPLGGVGWVAVAVTHRRQGVLTALMEAVHADIDGRGEPLAGLGASEGAIYPRFGYSPATMRRAVRIDRRLVSFDDRFTPRPDSVWLMAADDLELGDLVAERWDRYWRLRPGEVNRTAARQRALMAERGPKATYAVHRDGYAAWTVAPDWAEGFPQHELTLYDLAACTPEAHDELWATVLSVDLVGPVVTQYFPLDDPLPYQLTNYRAVQTTGLADWLWLNVRDIPVAFGARRYGTDDEIVMEVEGVRWTVGNDGCRRVRRRADIVISRDLLGGLLLGGVSVAVLGAAHRLDARSDEVLQRADALLRSIPQPHSQTGF